MPFPPAHNYLLPRKASRGKNRGFDMNRQQQWSAHSHSAIKRPFRDRRNPQSHRQSTNFQSYLYDKQNRLLQKYPKCIARLADIAQLLPSLLDHRLCWH